MYKKITRRFIALLLVVSIMMPSLIIPVRITNSYLNPVAEAAPATKSYLTDLFQTIDWPFVIKEYIVSLLKGFVKPCFCGLPAFIGMEQDFWSPSAITEVVSKNGNFPLIALKLSIPLSDLKQGDTDGASGNTEADASGDEIADNNYSRHVHLWDFPLFSLLDLLMCGKPKGLGLGYVSELDPTWSHPELETTLNPALLLLASLPVAIATGVDCAVISATGNNTASDAMFFSAGCYGIIYPDSGRSQTSRSHLHSDLLFFARSLSKGHLLASLFATTKAHAGQVCNPVYYPVLPRSEYLFSMIWPGTLIRGRYTKFAVGTSTVLFPELGMEIPTKEDDTLMLIYKHRQCCLL